MNTKAETLYDATILAAETIRNRPELFEFTSIKRPDFCGTPGCAIGWIEAFTNPSEYDTTPFLGRAEKVLAPVYPDQVIFNLPGIFYRELDTYDSNWFSDAHLCADALLWWAERHRNILTATPTT